MPSRLASRPSPLSIPSACHCLLRSCQYPCLASSTENGGTTKSCCSRPPLRGMGGTLAASEPPPEVSSLSDEELWRSGAGGAAFSGGAYEGVLAAWVVFPHALTTEELDEYFPVPADELETLDLWDKVSSFITSLCHLARL